MALVNHRKGNSLPAVKAEVASADTFGMAYPGGSAFRRGAALACACAIALAACGDPAPAPNASTAPVTVPAPSQPTSTVPDLAAAETMPVPPSAPTTIEVPATTTTAVPEPRLPLRFPPDFPVPPGAITRIYNGSPELGFQVSLRTGSDPMETLAYMSESIAGLDEWSLSLLSESGEAGVPGYEQQWEDAGPDHYWSQIDGPFIGSLEIFEDVLNIAMTPAAQPPSGRLPDRAPSAELVPRPETPLQSVGYAAGSIVAVYEFRDGAIEALIEAWRNAGWVEEFLQVAEPGDAVGFSQAVGTLAGWRLTLVDVGAKAFIVYFDDLELVYDARG